MEEEVRDVMKMGNLTTRGIVIDSKGRNEDGGQLNRKNL